MGAPASAAGAAFSRPKMAEAGMPVSASSSIAMTNGTVRHKSSLFLSVFKIGSSLFQCGTVILCEKGSFMQKGKRPRHGRFPFQIFQLVSHSGRERFFTPETMPMAAKSVTMDEPP